MNWYIHSDQVYKALIPLQRAPMHCSNEGKPSHQSLCIVQQRCYYSGIITMDKPDRYEYLLLK